LKAGLTILSRMKSRRHMPADVLEFQSRSLYACLWVAVGALSILVAIPSMFLALWALRGTETVGVLQNHITLHWFRLVVLSPEWQVSIVYSFTLAFVTSTVGCAILANHFFFLRYAPRWVEYSTYLLTILPAILPAIIYALALRLFGASLRLPEVCMLGLGHLVLVLPAQYFVFEAFQERIPTETLQAASTLGANSWRCLVHVYVPLLFGAVKSAFLVGFFFSFDEIIIASFVIDSPLVTVPKRLWDEVNRNMDPTPSVIATLLLLLCIATMVTLVGASALRPLSRLGRERAL